MRQHTDVFVIGGGPAGLAAAIAARQRGFNVMVADGAEPPIDKACGEGLMPDALAALSDLGVTVNPTEGFTFRGVRFLQEGAQVAANFPVGTGIGLRRPVLHQKLIDRAEHLGVTLLWKAPVSGISPEGVCLGGRTIPASWVVGADGIRSRVRRWCGLETAALARPRYAFRRHYRVTPWTDCMEVYWGRSAQAYITPVGRQDICAVLISRNADVRSASLAAEFPALAKRLDPGAAGADTGAVTMACSFDQVYRDRVALIGDASGSVDAITGEGLCLSFHQAMALARAFESGNLAEYQVAHRRMARRPSLMGRLLLTLDGRPKLRHRAIRVMAAHPELFKRLVAAHVGEASPAHLAATGALLGWRLVAA